MQGSWVPAMAWCTAAKKTSWELQSGRMHKPEAPLKAPPGSQGTQNFLFFFSKWTLMG